MMLCAGQRSAGACLHIGTHGWQTLGAQNKCFLWTRPLGVALLNICSERHTNSALQFDFFYFLFYLNGKIILFYVEADSEAQNKEGYLCDPVI